MTYGPIARIILRYASGALVSYGVMVQGTDLSLDPDLVLVTGAVVGFAAETAYAVAKRMEWST